MKTAINIREKAAPAGSGVYRPVSSALPEIGFLRLKQIVGDRKSGIAPLIPVSKSSWADGVKAGIYPKPVKIGGRANGWRVEDIRQLIAELSAG